MKRGENLQGALELLILKTLEHGPNHGFGISAHIAIASADLIHVEEGSLYPALHRLERDQLIGGNWSVTGNGRRARVYRLTEAGRIRLGEVKDSWKSVAKGVKKVLKF
ncbi:MAG: PadR family transcriptional regulator [Acidobacteriota bacterium]|nr:PadR family transcriptional regulator [Acidobacteriota bacterium]